MRIVIAEDLVLMRQGMVRLLAELDVEVVGEAGDAAQLLELVARHVPDAALIDIKLPPTHTDEGVRAAVAIREQHPSVSVLLLSSYLESRFAATLLGTRPAGAGYLLKERIADPAVLADALRRVAAGECVLDPEIVSRLLDRSREHGPLDDLSARELEILGLMAEGHSNAAICARLFLSPKTVESHVRNIFAKLGLVESPDSSRRVLAVLAYLRA